MLGDAAIEEFRGVELDRRLATFLTRHDLHGRGGGTTKPCRAANEVVRTSLLNGEEIVIKRAFGDTGSARIRREFVAYQYFDGNAPASVAALIPKVLCVDLDGRETGAPTLVLECLPGRPILEAVDPDDYPIVQRSLGARLQDMHQHRVVSSGFGSFAVANRRATAARFLANKLLRLSDAADEFGCPREILAFARKRGARVVDELETNGPAVPSLCHGDLHESNYSVEFSSGGWEVAGIFDLEHSGALDPIYDLGRSSIFARLHLGLNARSALLEGYGDLRGRAAHLRFFEVLHGLDLWSTYKKNRHVACEPVCELLTELVRGR